MRRESFVFYRGFYEAAQDLDDDQRLMFYDAVAEYALDGHEKLEKRSAARAVFKSVKPQIDVNNKRYENGRKGGRPKKQAVTESKPKRNQAQSKRKPNVNVNVNVNENVNENVTNKSKLDVAIENFKEHRRQLKAPMTEQAYKLMMTKLEKLSGGSEERKIAILNQSIENGWKGVFALKEKYNRFNNAQTREYDMGDLERRLLETN